jgi:hypothetical protein
MRVTTWFLMEHMSEKVALLVETFLMGDEDHFGFTKKGWSNIAIGGHTELIMKAFSKADKDKLHDLFLGFCSIGDINMVNRALRSYTVAVVREQDHRRKEDRRHNKLMAYLNGQEYNDDDQDHQNANTEDLKDAARICDEGLQTAIEDKQVEVGRLMLTHGASIKNDDENTLRMVKDVVSDGDYEVIRLIKDAGGMNRNMFIEYAAFHNDERIAKLVDNPTPQEQVYSFTCCCMYNCDDKVETFILGTQETMRSDIASFGLLYAASSRYDDTVKILLKFNANPNVGMPAACENGNQPIIDLLIAAGATGCSCPKPIAEHNSDYGKKRKRDARDAATRAFREKYIKK